MRLNFFLRGLGVGIVITTLILTISHSANRKMSDNEIIERAQELGMTFETQSESASKEETMSAFETTEQETTPKETTQSETTKQQTAQGETTQKETTQPETTKQQTAQGETTQSETTKEQTTQKETAQEESSQESTTAEKDDVITYTLTVVRGMSSNNVCRLLDENGIIDDAADFDNYLVSRGYAEKIRIGSFEVRSDMSYEELAAIFCSR